MAKQRVVIVGGGLAGLSAAMQLAEEEVGVALISMGPVKRSHSVCAQGGINCVNKFTRAQGDTEWNHFDDSVYGGEFLNNQPPVKQMCEWAPHIVDLADRLGVPFNRSDEGNLATRRFGGTLYKRTIYAGASTGQQLLYALDEQVRRWSGGPSRSTSFGSSSAHPGRTGHLPRLRGRTCSRWRSRRFRPTR